MRRSLLAPFRTSDARSLGWALSLLLALNVFVVGLHLGYAANATPGVVLCSLEQTSNSGSPTPATHQEPCCFAGCVSPTLGPASTPAQLADIPVIFAVPEVLRAAGLAANTPERANAPRGPPVLA